MICRLSKKLAQKVKKIDLPAIPPHSNPFLDWHAHLFTSNHVQYIMATNSSSLFSVFMYGAGVTNDGEFIFRLTDTLKEVLHGIDADLISYRIIVPGLKNVRFAKSQDRRVIGSMNDNLSFAKFVVGVNERRPPALPIGDQA